MEPQEPTGTPGQEGPSGGTPSAAPRARKRLARLGAGFVALVVPSFCLIVLGALVRAHEAGLACPDWPLCFGEVVPEFDLQVAFEWSHRALAGSVALCFAGLAAAGLWSPGLPRDARRWILVTAVLLGVQILLGALTVWHLLAAWTVTAHLVTGNAFALSLLLTGLGLRETARGGPSPRAAGPVRVGLALAAGLLLLQLVLGGLVSSRYAGLVCPEWPACIGGVWFPTWKGPVGLHLLHRWNAVAVVAGLCVAAVLARRTPDVAELARFAAVLAVVQMGVGIANVWLGIPVEVTGLHSALAAVLVLSVGTATWRAWHGARAGPATS